MEPQPPPVAALQNKDLTPPSSTTTTTHTHPTSTTTTTTTCCKCGGATTFAPPPSWSDTSCPPNYRPIRSPAINLPPNNSQQAIILAPVPKSQKVPTISPPFLFQAPTKKILSQDDLRSFHNSDSGKNFLGFVVALSESIRSHKISDHCHESQTLNSITSILETLIRWVDEIPPVQQSSRYGNYSFRIWHNRLTENSDSLMLQFLPYDLRSATVEIVPYFTDSFGNSIRIDYGTGHETNFAAWLYCLVRLGLLKEEDYHGVVARVFVKYLELMRKLQLVYCLEPAGSHGVWGLDDYHFLPFIFGSSQLIDHKYMKPKSIHNQDILDNFSKEYLYLSCIAFVKIVKKGLFAEHSPLLDDISGVPTWNKVNSGMLKMYKVEVLEKVPIMQHFLFGWLIKWLVNLFCQINGCLGFTSGYSDEQWNVTEIEMYIYGDNIHMALILQGQSAAGPLIPRIIHDGHLLPMQFFCQDRGIINGKCLGGESVVTESDPGCPSFYNSFPIISKNTRSEVYFSHATATPHVLEIGMSTIKNNMECCYEDVELDDWTSEGYIWGDLTGDLWIV